MKIFKHIVITVMSLLMTLPVFSSPEIFAGLHGDFVLPGILNGGKTLGLGGGAAIEGGVYLGNLSLGLLGEFSYSGDSGDLIESMMELKGGVEAGYDFEKSLIPFFPTWLAIRPNVAVLGDYYMADGYRSKSKKILNRKEESKGFAVCLEPSLFVDIVNLIDFSNISIIPNLGYTESIRFEKSGVLLSGQVSLGARVIFHPRNYEFDPDKAGTLNVVAKTASDEFTPDGDGKNDTVEFTVTTDADDHGGAAMWELRIYDPGTNIFYTQKGKGDVPQHFTWEGENIRNDEIQSGALYQYVWYVKSKDGSEGYVPGLISTGIMVKKDAEGHFNISLSSITFGPNSSKFDNLSKDEIARNNQLFDQVADVLKNFSDYKVTVEGHANNVSGTEREHLKELLPLSQARAETVCAELEKRGISKDRLTAVGRGSEKMITTKKSEAWKNRRVEFILIKEEE